PLVPFLPPHSNCARAALDRSVEPSESVDRGCLGLVLAAHPAGVTEFVKTTQEVVVVDLARARLVASRIICYLNVCDARQMLGDSSRQLSLHPLHVVDVVLKPQVSLADRIEHLQRLLGPAEVETQYIIGVDRLNEQLDLLLVEGSSGKTKVVD